MKVPIKAALAGGAAAAALTLAQTACADLTPQDLIDELERLSEIEWYDFSWDGVEETESGVWRSGYLKTVEIGSSLDRASAEWTNFIHSDAHASPAPRDLLDKVVRADAESAGTSRQGVGAGDLISVSARNPKTEIDTDGSNSHFLLEAKSAEIRLASSDAPTDVDASVGSSSETDDTGENEFRSLLQVSGKLEIEFTEAPDPNFITAGIKADFSGNTVWEALVTKMGLSVMSENPAGSLAGTLVVHGPVHLFGVESAAAIPDDRIDGPVTFHFDNLAVGLDGLLANVIGSLEVPDLSVPDPLDAANADLTIELKGIRWIKSLLRKLRKADLLDFRQYLVARGILWIGDETGEDALLYRIEKQGQDLFDINEVPFDRLL